MTAWPAWSRTTVQRAALLSLLLALSGCAQFPEVAPVSQSDPGTYPALLPIDQILAQADQ